MFGASPSSLALLAAWQSVKWHRPALWNAHSFGQKSCASEPEVALLVARDVSLCGCLLKAAMDDSLCHVRGRGTWQHNIA